MMMYVRFFHTSDGPGLPIALPGTEGNDPPLGIHANAFDAGGRDFDTFPSLDVELPERDCWSATFTVNIL